MTSPLRLGRPPPASELTVTQELRCPACRTQHTVLTHPRTQAGQDRETHRFSCLSCGGAELSVDLPEHGGGMIHLQGTLPSRVPPALLLAVGVVVGVVIVALVYELTRA